MKFTKMSLEDADQFSTYVTSGSYDSYKYTISITATKLIVNFAGNHYALSLDELMHEIAQDRRDAIKVAKQAKALRKQETHF